MTHNGLENNKEQLYRLTDPVTLQQVEDDFDTEWEMAIPVEDETIQKMMKNHEKRVQDARDKQDEKAASSGQGRTVSRSLSVELERVDEESETTEPPQKGKRDRRSKSVSLPRTRGKDRVSNIRPDWPEDPTPEQLRIALMTTRLDT